MGEYIIHIYGITKQPETGFYMMVMQWCENGDLGHNLHHIHTYANVCRMAEDIIRGLKEIHLSGLVHQDIHPGNILLDENRIRAYITDLGLCRQVNQEANSSDSVYGVLPYIAPEVLNGKSYTQAADIYSFGMIMWVLFCREPPFSDMDWKNESDLWWKKVQGQGQPEILNWIPEQAAKLISDCLNIDPLMRPTAEQIEDLIPSLAGYYHEVLPSALPSTIQAAHSGNPKFSIKHSLNFLS